MLRHGISAQKPLHVTYSKNAKLNMFMEFVDVSKQSFPRVCSDPMTPVSIPFKSMESKAHIQVSQHFPYTPGFSMTDVYMPSNDPWFYGLASDSLSP